MLLQVVNAIILILAVWITVEGILRFMTMPSGGQIASETR
jgi:hypothetical protein